MQFIKDMDEERNEKEAQERIDAFEKSLNLSTIDSLEKIEKVCKKMQSFQKKYKNIKYIKWGCSNETEIYSTLRRRILDKIPNDNHLSILKDVVKVEKSSKAIIREEFWYQSSKELWYQLLFHYYCDEKLSDLINIDNETLEYCFNNYFYRLNIIDKILKIFNSEYAYLSNNDKIIIAKLANIIKKEDVVFAIKHRLDSKLIVYKYLNSNLVDDALREVGVYDTNNEKLKPLYLKVPVRCIPYDLLKTETIEYMLMHTSRSLLGNNPTGKYDDGVRAVDIFDFELDTICGGYDLIIDKHIAGYCLKKANEGEHKLLDILLDNIMSSNLITYKSTHYTLFDLIEKIQDKKYKKQIMDKYGITE